jgi:DNA-binding transcriptional ArsR family regulator
MGEYRRNRLDAVFGAVADPTRRAILSRLASSPARVTDLASEFPISLNSTSKHIRILERAGLLSRMISGREHLLTLNAEPLAEAAEWIGHYREFWTVRLAALESFVKGRRNAEKQRKKK